MRAASIVTALLIISFGFTAGTVRAQSTLGPANLGTSSAAIPADQTQQINNQISQLESEITQLQSQLNTTSKQKQTLQNAISALNLNIQKLSKNITLTQDQIAQNGQQLNALSSSIATTTTVIVHNKNSVANLLFQLNTDDNESPLFSLLAGGTLSSVFDQIAALETVRDAITSQVTSLTSLKSNLESSQAVTEAKQKELSTLKSNLTQQQQGLAISKSSQTQLLKETSDKESSYEALITEKKNQESQFEQQLNAYGSQIGLGTGNYGIPPPGPILSWPVSNTVITQYFGDTPFATKNAQVYDGHGHDGIDLRASPGTPVHAALTGTIAGTGNTDLTCPYASFGKWIFIQHNNGLSTMYAHLATILVTPGQQVTTGQLIGYSDTTGYAIGPHLHFGVYATAGTKITVFPSAGCKPKHFTIPVATLSAYLNPLSYLPPLPKN